MIDHRSRQLSTDAPGVVGTCSHQLAIGLPQVGHDLVACRVVGLDEDRVWAKAAERRSRGAKRNLIFMGSLSRVDRYQFCPDEMAGCYR
jgi:hypothetical protein